MDMKKVNEAVLADLTVRELERRLREQRSRAARMISELSREEYVEFDKQIRIRAED